MPYCPNCGKQISLTAKFCRECGCNLKADEVLQEQPIKNISAQECAVHPKMNAVGVCAECGVGVCVICKSDVKDKLYCPNCMGAIGRPVKGNYIQRDLDWLQNFRTQHEEVIQLSLELQNIAKEISLIPQESENIMSGGVGEQLKELQRRFANLEKALNSGPKPKSSDLRKMNRSLQSACVYFGVACVAFRKWADQPSSAIEVYTTERLEKARESMDKVNEQLELLSNQPLSLHEKSKEELSQSKPTGKCAEHHQNDAIGKCTDCGKEICNVCLTTTTFKIKESQNVILAALTALADKLYCPSCIDKLINKTIENTSNLATELPQAVPDGWNWGAFLLGLIWGAFNGAPAFVLLLWFVPGVGIGMAFVLGAYGNKWAWEKDKFKDIELFKRTQRKWAYAGVVVYLIMFLFGIILGAVGI
jgi:hypothetical protein